VRVRHEGRAPHRYAWPRTYGFIPPSSARGSALPRLEPAVVADLAPRLAELRAAPGVLELLWPGAPLADAHLVLGAIEHLEGRPRPAARRHRRGGPMPGRLDVSEHERWRDPALAEVFRLVQERTGSPLHGPHTWQLPRLRGRYSPG
jgi:hypothetical protein